MQTIEKKYTTSDFRKIEEGTLCQLINGEIIMSPSPSFKHQEISAQIFTQIFLFVKTNKLGKVVCAPMDVYFNTENAYQPDILFISTERLNIIKEDGIYGAPDLIVEILSPSNSNIDTITKKNIYEKYGVKEYWIVNPINSEVIGYKFIDNKFEEFYKGTGFFYSDLLNLKIEF